MLLSDAFNYSLKLFLKGILSYFLFAVLVAVPLFLSGNDTLKNDQEENSQLIESYENRIEEIEQQLERAHFTKVVMEDNLRNNSLTRPKEDTSWQYLLLSNFILLGVVIYQFVKRKKNNYKVPKSELATQTEETDSSKQLTERELDVLNLIVKLKSNPEISKTLFISRNTTKTHVANILKKLEVANRQEAARKARELNLVSVKSGKREVLNSLPKLILLAYFLIGVFSLQAQTIIDNQTSCSYLIKVNVLAKENCRLYGEGPLLKLGAKQEVRLPKIPKSSWIAAYGIEEVGENIEAVVMVGSPTCNFRSLVKAYGGCKATLKFDEGHLTLVEEN